MKKIYQVKSNQEHLAVAFTNFKKAYGYVVDVLIPQFHNDGTLNFKLIEDEKERKISYATARKIFSKSNSGLWVDFRDCADEYEIDPTTYTIEMIELY